MNIEAIMPSREEVETMMARARALHTAAIEQVENARTVLRQAEKVLAHANATASIYYHETGSTHE